MIRTKHVFLTLDQFREIEAKTNTEFTALREPKLSHGKYIATVPHPDEEHELFLNMEDKHARR